MSDIIRAWKDEAYRLSLSVEEQSALPANPAGEISLTDEELEAVYGAFSGGFGVEAEDNRQWNFSGGFFVEDYSCNSQSAGGYSAPGGYGAPGGGGAPGGYGAPGGGAPSGGGLKVSNKNSNTATSTSTSQATGGTATVTSFPGIGTGGTPLLGLTI